MNDDQIEWDNLVKQKGELITTIEVAQAELEPVNKRIAEIVSKRRQQKLAAQKDVKK